MTFEAAPLPRLPEALAVRGALHRDARGWFQESWEPAAFARLGVSGPFVLEAQAHNGPAGVVRGLYFQAPPAAQGTLVRCVAGRAFDAVVDVRPASPRFGRWDALTLAAGEPAQLWVPPGFAHGYATLEPGTSLAYKLTAPHAPGHERAIRWDDPDLGIPWPVRDPVLSAKDAAAPAWAAVARALRPQPGKA